MSEMQEVIVMAEVRDPEERKGGMRLNVGMKAEVVANAIQHGFGKRRALLLKEENAIHKLAWLKCFGPAALKHALALGKPWIMDSSSGRYNSPDKDGLSIQFSIDGHYFNLRGHMPLPMHGFSNGIKELRIKDESLGVRTHAWHNDVADLSREQQKVEATLKAMLDRITTYPSLEKNWPAGKKFYRHLPTKYPFRHQVPAVLIDELNAALDI